MPFVVCEDVGTTARKRLSPRDVLAAWERTKGICVTCGERIDGVRQRWFVEHVIALENSGTDTPGNRGPAHFDTCKRVKDAADHSAAAKAKRRKRAQLGVTAAMRPKIQSRGFAKAPPQNRASTKLSKWFGPRFPLPLTRKSASADLLLIIALMPGNASAIATIIILAAYFWR